MKKNFIQEYLTDEELDKISQGIKRSEGRTSGEIRLCIKRRKSFLEKKLSPRQIALREFKRLKMHKTKDKTGVLILIIFDDHKFEIIADEGINSKISSRHWGEITERMKSHFVNKNFLDGIMFAIEDIGETLSKEFPRKHDDTDELSNEVIVR